MHENSIYKKKLVKQITTVSSPTSFPKQTYIQKNIFIRYLILTTAQTWAGHILEI